MINHMVALHTNRWDINAMKETRLSLTVCFFVLLLCLPCFGQVESDYFKTNNAKESLRVAQNFVNKGMFTKAEKQLRHTIKLKGNFAVAHRELGRVYLELDKFDEAAKSLEKSFDLDPNISRAAYFECGEAYFQLRNIHKALHYFEYYKSLKGGKYTNAKRETGLEAEYDELLSIRKKNCIFISDMGKIKEPEQMPVNLGSSINSDSDEYLPTITTGGGRLIFTRNKGGINENIMTSSFDGQRWSGARAFDKNVNTHGNEGMAKFATNGREFYFAGCNRPDSEGGCDLYKAYVDMFGQVEQVSHLHGINSGSWDSQPCITCQGEAVYFSSTREGGYGGSDIYVSFLKEDGSWAPARNLGPNINTPQNEEAPFIATDGKTLYFTSDGWPGQGDGDIFKSTRDLTGNWSEAENLGYPINTPSKELGFYIKADGKSVLFASARMEGFGGLDVYEYSLNKEQLPEPMVHVEGMIVDDYLGIPVETEFTVSRKGEEYTFRTDERGRFFTCLKGDQAFTFIIEEEGYLPFMKAVFLPSSDNSETTPVMIRLEPANKAHPSTLEAPPKPSVISAPKELEKRVNFFFAVNSFELDDNSKAKLDDLIGTLSRNDQWSVEVVGFADNSGDAQYNKILSEKRAKSVSDYLKEAGVDIHNVNSEGRGAVTAASDREMKYNRRVEVVLRYKENGSAEF